MSQAYINSIGLILIGSMVTAFWAWFWRFRTTTVKRLEDEKAAVAAKADKLAKEHQELVAAVAELKSQLGLVSQVVTPINQAMQALLIRELTHYHTPELDALMAKLPPDGNLTEAEQLRIIVLLRERADELNGTIPESEREAAIILPYIIKRVKVEAESIANALTDAPQLKIVAVPPDTGPGDMESPEAAVEGKKADELDDKRDDNKGK